MMKSYDTYIFDLDGTLLDTLWDLMESTNYALRQYGLPERTYPQIRAAVGNGVRLLVERSVPEGERHPHFEEIFTAFREHYLRHGMDKTRPYDGILPLLDRLCKAGKKMAVVTNKFKDATEEICAHYFGDIFDVTVGEQEGLRHKPYPDMVEEALRQLGATKENAVYVGDSDVDFMTARNSGLPCISVLWGFRDRDVLEKLGATNFVATPDEIF